MKNTKILITAFILFPLSAATKTSSIETFMPVFQTETIELQQTSGKQDRELWVDCLWKISYPVIHNLAQHTLAKNMPVETVSGERKPFDEMTYLEAMGRTLAGLAPWLELPDDNTKEGKLRKQMRKETLMALKNAVDPQSPDFINFTKHAQPIVDAAYLVHAFLRAPNALWKPLDKETKQRYLESFKSLRNRTGAYNNWLIFTGLTEAFLLQQGEEAEPFRLKVANNKVKEWYIGDGWYKDGPLFSMDNYNAYVFHPMYVAMLEAMLEGKNLKDAADKDVSSIATDLEVALKRMVRHAEFCERQIGPHGDYPAFGRSVTYRSASFQTLADVALRGKLPEYISEGQVRCALTAVHRNMYAGNQNFDQNGWLVLGFNGHQPAIADDYTSTGSLYMATLSFLPLGLPANHSFWTSEPQKWTSQKAWGGNDFRKDYKVKY